MIIVLFLIIAFAVVMVFNGKTQWNHSGWIAASVVSGILLGIACIILPVSFFHSLSAYSELAAYSAVYESYSTTVDKTADVVVELNRGELINVAPSVENYEHSTQTAQRIKEARDYHRKIMETLNWYKTVNNYWFFRQWIAKTPDDIKTMIIEGVK